MKPLITFAISLLFFATSSVVLSDDKRSVPDNKPGATATSQANIDEEC